MAERKAWKDLSPAYRQRLTSHGVTARTHGVANLTGARGHPSRPPTGAAPSALVGLLVSGEALPQDFKTAASKFTRPSWVPKSAPVDVAAALSQLPNPKRWQHVEFIPRADGEAWTMIVELKGNAYDNEILIPGGGGAGTGAKDVLQIVTDIQREPKKTKALEAAAVFFEVNESDEEAA